MSSPSSELKLTRQFIRAGAGAGKTTRLVETFYEFAKSFHRKQGRWPKVFLTTFTKKATQEIKERLLEHALKNNDAEFVGYLAKSSLVQISTIHLLLQNILFRFHDRINLVNQINLIDDREELNQLFRLVKQELSVKPEFTNLLEHFRIKELTEYIQKCVRLRKEFPNFNFVPVETLTSLAEKKIHHIVDTLNGSLKEFAGYQDGLSADWKAYAEHVQSYVRLLQSGKILEAMSVFNQLPRKPNFSKAKPPFPVEINEIFSDLSKGKDLSLGFSDTPDFRQIHFEVHQLFDRLFIRIYELWLQIQLSTGQITISDLELLSLQIAQRHPEEMAQFAKETDFIMLDEYQDTSPLQVKILQTIIDNTSVFIVGDPQQSIYLFRGARTEVFLNQEKKSENSHFEMISLMNNYRSHPEILKFFNAFFSNVSNQFVAMQPGRKEKEKFSFPRVQFVDSGDQLQAALLKILQLHQSGVAFENICVLSKKNSDLLELNSILNRHRIPSDLQTAAGLESKREILDCVSFLKFIVNPFDDENLLKLLRSPWFLVSDADLFDLRQKNTDCLWQAIRGSQPLVHQKLKEYLNIYLESGFLVAFEKFIFSEGLLTHSMALDPSGRIESNVFKFYQLLYQKSLNTDFDLNKFVDEKSFLTKSIDMNGLSESLPARKNSAVNLLTIHGSKGLQYNHVIVIGMNDQIRPTHLMPLTFDEQHSLYALNVVSPEDNSKISSDWAVNQRRAFNQRETDESYRLLYVAMTRAQETICLIAEAKSRDHLGTWKNLLGWPIAQATTPVGEPVTFKGVDVVLSTMSTAWVQEQVLQLLPTERLKCEITAKRPFVWTNNNRLTHLSVSDLLNLKVERLKDLQRMTTISKEKRESKIPLSDRLIDAQAKALAGTRAHTLFESIKYNDFLSDAETMKTLSDEENKAIHYLKNLTDIPFLKMIENGYVEFGFKLKMFDYVIQGQIDAWGQVGSEIYLIDYKTGDQKYVDKAFAQLSLYAECLAQMKLIKATDGIKLVAIFPFEGKTMIQTADLF